MHSTLHRFLSVFLCIALILSLAACGGQGGESAEDGKSGAAGVLSGGKGEKEKQVPAAVSEEAKDSLARLRDCMEFSDQIAGAVAYLGYREQGDPASLERWLRKNCDGLTREMPFLLEIPPERILGEEHGDLYCIVPRDENTSLAVNRVRWETAEYSVWPVTEEVLYREENARPVLVFVNFEQWREEPDTEIVLVTNGGVEVNWCPLNDEYGVPVVPIGEDYVTMLLDFAFFGSIVGSDYPEGWDSGGWSGYPTDMGLADTTWKCEHWFMELQWENADPDYSGAAELYYQAEKDQAYTLAYSGVWRMEEDCLHLEVFDSAGAGVIGNFPVRNNFAGETLNIRQDPETGVCPPFFGDGVSEMNLELEYTFATE